MRARERERDELHAPHINVVILDSSLWNGFTVKHRYSTTFLKDSKILFFVLFTGNLVCSESKLNCYSLLEFPDRTLFRLFYRVSPTQRRRLYNKEWKSFLRKKLLRNVRFYLLSIIMTAWESFLSPFWFKSYDFFSDSHVSAKMKKVVSNWMEHFRRRFRGKN